MKLLLCPRFQLRQLLYLHPDSPQHGDNTGYHAGNNHYGTHAVILAIQNIAKEYARTHNGDLLNIGEISLPMGGVFDFWGDWNPAESNDHHKAHACGTDVDVHVQASGKSIPPIDLATIARQQFPGAFVTTEGDHYHIHFADCTFADANPDFSIACPSGVTKVVRGTSTDINCTITSQQGFNRQVNLACQPPNNQPSITCKISPTSTGCKWRRRYKDEDNVSGISELFSNERLSDGSNSKGLA
jgi:hypothetical protein